MNKIFIVIYAFNLTYKLTTIKKLSAMGEFFMVGADGLEPTTRPL